MKGFLLFISILSLLVSSFQKARAQTDQTVPSAASTPTFSFPAGGCIYNWVNSNTTIGLAASGTGNIASFTAINSSNVPVTAVITATPVAAGFAYIANQADGTVSVINTSTETIVSAIVVGNGPDAVALSPDGNRLYVANTGLGFTTSFSVINTVNNTVISTVNINGTPTGVSVSPDGSRLYVSTAGSFNSGSILVFNTVTNTLLSTINLDFRPFGISVSPDGTRLYVANESYNSIAEVSTSTNLVVATITAGAHPYGVLTSPDGALLYSANNGSNDVTVINTITNTEIATIPVGMGPYGIAVSPKSTMVYVSNSNSNTVSVINSLTNSVTATIAVGQLPTGLSVNADGSRLYVTNKNSNNVSVINTTTNTVIAEVSAGGNPDSFGNFVTGGASCSAVSFTITVNPSSAPSIYFDSNSLSALNSLYGTPSASSSFTVFGRNLTSDILVTAPLGFEVSTDNINFSNTATVGTAATNVPTLFYIRLAATANSGIHSGNIVLSSAGVAVNQFAMPRSNVSPASLIVKANGLEKQYGNTLNGDSGYIYFDTSGLQNSDLILSVTVAYGAGSEANAAPGTYTSSVNISAATGINFNPSNYSITYVPGDITVIQPQVAAITASGALSALTTSYGTPSASESFTVSGAYLTAGITITPPQGFEVSTTSTSFTGTVTVGAAGSLTQTVVYIRLTGVAAAGNYSGNVILSSPGTTGAEVMMPSSTVNPAPLTITADDKTRSYGIPNPVFTITYSGFVNGEGTAQLNYQPLITTTAIITSPAGEYPITASGAVAANYIFTYIPGVLTITSLVAAIVIPNTFTPNGDGINDSWNLKFIDYFPGCTVTIFTRYGEKVYSSIGYPVPWDGRYKGAVLPTGVYYYIINENNGSGLLTGNVTIIR